MTTLPTKPEGLTPEQLSTFNRDGYLVIPDALPAATVQGLLAETRALLAGLDLSSHPLTRFSTGDGGGDRDGRDHVGDAYFLGSGDKVRFFLEEDAFVDGALARPKEQAVNKIGHCLHELSEPFRRLLLEPNGDSSTTAPTPTPASIARSLAFADPRVLQSMVICKPAGTGGAVPPHQDSCFLYTSPPSAVGFWYALEDAARENGCLWFLPGSHRRAAVGRRLVRRVAGVADGEAGGTVMVGNEGAGFPGGEGYGVGGEGAEEEGEYVPAEVKAGTLVLIHGNLLHKSEKNLGRKGRIIYTFHIIEAEGTVYDERNWLQPPAGGFTRLYK